MTAIEKEEIQTIIRQELREALSLVIKNNSEKKYLSVAEAAEYIGISLSKMYRLVNDNEIPHCIVGTNQIRISRIALDHYMESGEKLTAMVATRRTS